MKNFTKVFYVFTIISIFGLSQCVLAADINDPIPTLYEDANISVGETNVDLTTNVDAPMKIEDKQNQNTRGTEQDIEESDNKEDKDGRWFWNDNDDIQDETSDNNEEDGEEDDDTWPIALGFGVGGLLGGLLIGRSNDILAFLKKKKS